MLKRRVVNPFALILLVALSGLDFFSTFTVPWYYYALVVFLWIAITACGSFFVGWNYHMESMHRNPHTDGQWVSLSFDDGPNPHFTPKVLDLLRQFDAKATFFCIGKNIETYPKIVERILREGHSIGNHTYSHSRSFGFFGTQKIMDELLKTKSVIKTLTSLEMKLYRPAFGVTNPQIEKTVGILGLSSIGWSVRSLDTTPRSENRILRRITSRMAKGDIILLHDTSEKTISVLERLLVFLREKNLESVPIERLLEIDAYEQP